jgi:hypothetical protein
MLIAWNTRVDRSWSCQRIERLSPYHGMSYHTWQPTTTVEVEIQSPGLNWLLANRALRFQVYHDGYIVGVFTSAVNPPWFHPVNTMQTILTRKSRTQSLQRAIGGSDGLIGSQKQCLYTNVEYTDVMSCSLFKIKQSALLVMTAERTDDVFSIVFDAPRIG